ncbi:hypothetical protein PR048_032460 [Dryococelus australis]|uniref:Uncharacterized protein n=1 Tax=Dryococelus australis TaxID=614101 RepID=A0ABQ9G299_9NEOP|nr:hypothetical protein PR048_032460 [Dryococelus australis]
MSRKTFPTLQKFTVTFNLTNLSLHEQDFMLKAQWSFFATIHGKTEYDGIGRTVEQLARKESLQRPLDSR